jgi:hypothetical protein
VNAAAMNFETAIRILANIAARMAMLDPPADIVFYLAKIRY